MKDRGFTLIELLVVVAIIALLVAILVPNLSEADRIARMVVCRTHLRQIALGMSLYANADPHELYPTFKGQQFPDTVVQDDPSMPGYYFRVSICGIEPPGNFKTWMDIVFSYVDRTLGIFVCTDLPDPTTQDPPHTNPTHYGYNAHIGWRGNQANRPGSLSLKVWEIKRPSQIALVQDYAMVYSYNVWWDYQSYASGFGFGDDWDPFRAHGPLETNMAFVDQHVEAVDRFDPEYFDYYHWDGLQD